VKNVFNVIRGKKKIGSTAINAGNAILDKWKTITTVKNAIYVYEKFYQHLMFLIATNVQTTI
jgi:hypothetical protein